MIAFVFPGTPLQVGLAQKKHVLFYNVFLVIVIGLIGFFFVQIQLDLDGLYDK